MLPSKPKILKPMPVMRMRSSNVAVMKCSIISPKRNSFNFDQTKKAKIVSQKEHISILQQVLSPRSEQIKKSMKTKSLIKIKILSNWGHESEVSCHKIDILNDKNTILNVNHYAFNIPKNKPTNLVQLFNTGNSSSTMCGDWTEQWPPEKPFESHKIFIGVDEDCIGGIRVWPSSDFTKNIKEVSISINGTKVFKGDFPKDIPEFISFGTVLANPMNSVREGSIVFTPHRITICPLATYGNTTVFGINTIMFFDKDGNKIEINKLYSITAMKCKPTANMVMLTKEPASDAKYEMEMFETWSAEPVTNSLLCFITKKKISIGAIVILNPLLHPDTPDIEVSRAKILFDGKCMWNGRFKRRGVEQPNERDCANYIFFHEDIDYQKDIREKAFPLRRGTMKFIE